MLLSYSYVSLCACRSRYDSPPLASAAVRVGPSVLRTPDIDTRSAVSGHRRDRQA